MKSQCLKVSVEIQKPVEEVWEAWNSPADIQKWNIPFDDWHCPFAVNDLREDMGFHYRMETTDGREGFDYRGTYLKISPLSLIETVQDDGRMSNIEFRSTPSTTVIAETFEPEDQTPWDIQEEFCRSVLNRFKKYVESK
jgi:uncharacterized protein YndB with AHSA1/START domain